VRLTLYGGRRVGDVHLHVGITISLHIPSFYL